MQLIIVHFSVLVPNFIPNWRGYLVVTPSLHFMQLTTYHTMPVPCTMLASWGVDAFWALVTVLALFDAHWDSGKVRWNCLLWCLHGMSLYAVTFKDCVMGALLARFSD